MLPRLFAAHILAAAFLVFADTGSDTQRQRWIGPSTGMAFVRVEAGTFVMGSPADEAGREASETQHTVTITRAFWMASHEVTQAEWLSVMGANPSHFRGDTRRPVENVTWHDVQEFLRRLSARNAPSRYRLPTEAEWEYACRAGTTTAYAAGETLTPADANIAGAIEDSIAGLGSTRGVGAFAPNAWGLHDMSGNVWEWTADDAPAPGDGFKIIRGGSWYYEADSARCALRYTHRPQDRGFSLGFRVIRE